MTVGPNPWSNVAPDRATTIALTAYVLAVGTLLAVALAVLWGAA
ncbi:hypothetical protein RHODGE_RHODGE_00999 [Rhodoplanes serenus]|uniref:Uncharacterized protein n=1 Tax=Rhodoplanes serenus TaxID=200615 RepID=A0A3S4AZA9_9BRAD|nr:hypothetical protein [Rhodoplanes serenus]VCU06611.1 hypothetical protein RHODPL_RHODPL_00059 [Rhodoplanes serenus]VCU07849.1 hypothetical protein RHODGE_RHODGE_00999 [Rhodoplanes serenus]